MVISDHPILSVLSKLTCRVFQVSSVLCPVQADLPGVTSLVCPLSSLRCPVLAVLSLSWPSYHVCPVMVVRSRLSCPCFPVIAVSSMLSCSGRPVLFFLLNALLLSCPSNFVSVYLVPSVLSLPVMLLPPCIVLAVQFWLSCTECPVLVVLSFLSFSGCPDLVVESRLYCLCCTVLVVRSQLSCLILRSVLFFPVLAVLTCLSLLPSCTALAVIF
jgi:hypothetical protein